MRDAIDRMMRTLRVRASRGDVVPRRMRPHVARSTFTPARDAGLARSFGA